MNQIPDVVLFVGVVIGGSVALWAFVAAWAHRQNERNDPSRHHHESMS